MSDKMVKGQNKLNKPKGSKKVHITNYKKEYDNETGKVSFLEVNHHKECCIKNWKNKELERLIDTFKTIESLKWKDIKKHSGLRYKSNDFIAIKPPKLPPDATFSSMRVSEGMRIFGYRSQEIFYIVWFDKNHSVCPEDKSKPYKVNA